MTKWNPNAISTVGNEWRVWYADGSYRPPLASLIRSTANETIDSVLMPHFPSGAPSSYGKLWAEIYDVANLGLNETPQIYTFLPNKDTYIISVGYYPSGGPGFVGPFTGIGNNLWQYINDPQLELWSTLADYLVMPYGDTVSYARFQFNTDTLPAGRVLSVSVEVDHLAHQVTAPAAITVDIRRLSNTLVQTLGTIQPPVKTPSTAPALMTTTLGPYYLDPTTREPWTRSDVIRFSVDGDYQLQLYTTLTSGGNQNHISAIRLKVAMVSEKRVAVGPSPTRLSPLGGPVTSEICALKHPAGTPDNWAKATATDYLVVMRNLVDAFGVYPTQSYYFYGLDSGSVNPENQAHAYTVTVAADGRLLTATGPETKTYGIVLAKTTGDLSVDSQPYWTLARARVYSGVNANQRFSSHGSTAYRTVRAVIGRVVGAPPNANLTVQVKRVSDNAVMGGTATLTPAQIFEHPLIASAQATDWYDVQIELSSSATLVAGTQYYLEFSSSSAQATSWQITALSELHDWTFGADQSYGGTTDYALVAGTTQTQMDLAATLSVPPPAGPASITVTTVAYALPDNGGAVCPAGNHEVARIAWAATSEGTLFSHYEVQRSENGGASWSTIKRGFTEAAVTFDDVTAARNVTLKYRVRTVRTTGLASSWRTQSTTTTLAVNTEAVVFATNYDSTLTTGFVWLNPRHRYEFLSDREVNVLQLHARDFSVVFRGTEDRGVEFTFDLLVYVRDDETDCGGTPPSGKGDEAFASLRTIVESEAPVLAVFTPFGKRIFGAGRIAGGDLDAESALYATTVHVIQTASVDAVTEI